MLIAIYPTPSIVVSTEKKEIESFLKEYNGLPMVLLKGEGINEHKDKIDTDFSFLIHLALGEH